MYIIYIIFIRLYSAWQYVGYCNNTLICTQALISFPKFRSGTARPTSPVYQSPRPLALAIDHKPNGTQYMVCILCTYISKQAQHIYIPQNITNDIQYQKYQHVD